jgi:crossover junction endodeoxyribonuclease RuvC
MVEQMKILGLDLSLTRSGWASGRDAYGLLIPPKTHADGIPRIDWVMRQVIDTLAIGVDLVVIEGYSFGQARGTSHSHAQGELGGLVRWALFRKGISYVEIPPATLKKFATGKGNANKELMLAEAVRRLDYRGRSDNNEADALWLWMLGAEAYGFGGDVVPKAQRDVAANLKWPRILTAAVA